MKSVVGGMVGGRWEGIRIATESLIAGWSGGAGALSVGEGWKGLPSSRYVA